jgi:hypothetical protein
VALEPGHLRSASGGHLRIEMRALPSGPTVIDMLANAAFVIGLSQWLAEQDSRWTYQLSFERTEHNFYRAAQHGLAAVLSWPFGASGGVRMITAAQLLPAARDGLQRAGVAAAHADRLLGVISARLAAGQTGAVWQRRALAAVGQRLAREPAVAAMFERYLYSALPPNSRSIPGPYQPAGVDQEPPRRRSQGISGPRSSSAPPDDTLPPPGGAGTPARADEHAASAGDPRPAADG